jgi:hypothetical protein
MAVFPLAFVISPCAVDPSITRPNLDRIIRRSMVKHRVRANDSVHERASVDLLMVVDLIESIKKVAAVQRRHYEFLGAHSERRLVMTIDLNTYLTDAGIPLDKTLVMRHTPTEKSLLKRLPNWAASNPEMYNNYQSNQNPVQEKQLSLATHLASFIGLKTSEALFVGIYKVEGWKEIPVAEFTEMEVVKKLYGYGSRPKNQHHVKWFDLRLMPQMAELKGRLVLTWAEMYAARSWSRWAAPNTFPVKTIHEESVLVPPMPSWRDLVLEWAELQTLPESWKAKLREWRAIYLIHGSQSLSLSARACLWSRLWR